MHDYKGSYLHKTTFSYKGKCAKVKIILRFYTKQINVQLTLPFQCCWFFLRMENLDYTISMLVLTVFHRWNEHVYQNNRGQSKTRHHQPSNTSNSSVCLQVWHYFLVFLVPRRYNLLVGHQFLTNATVLQMLDLLLQQKSFVFFLLKVQFIISK